ncbi:MAG: hypothetical protein AABX70_05750 [Nanoarchaeota archaeon]
MLLYLILLILYLVPVGGYYLAKQCGKEPQQGKRVFEFLHLLLLVGAVLYLTYYTHVLVLVFSLILYIPLHWKAKSLAGSSLMGFLYSLSVSNKMLFYEFGILLILYGLVEGTLYTLKSKNWRGLLKQQLPFLILGLVGLLAINFIRY